MFQKFIEHIPRINLAFLPTPLQEARNLSTFLGGPRIFFKRDDLTGLACGGNKVRKLEFLLADAIKEKADYIVTGGGTQSNHACQTAAACNRAGLKVRLLLKKPENIRYEGNILLEKLMDAEIRFLSGDQVEYLNEAIDLECEELKKKGHTPYGIPLGGSNPLGVVSYGAALFELKEQLEENNIKADRIFTACGTGGTLAGLLLGKVISGCNSEICGVTVGAIGSDIKSTVLKLFLECASFFNIKDIEPPPFTIYDYTGPGYAIITDKAIEAIEMVARTEGIFLDPVYTGKAMAGMIDLIRKGHIDKKETVIFIHTGGLPGLFAYSRDFYGAH